MDSFIESFFPSILYFSAAKPKMRLWCGHSGADLTRMRKYIWMYSTGQACPAKRAEADTETFFPINKYILTFPYGLLRPSYYPELHTISGHPPFTQHVDVAPTTSPHDLQPPSPRDAPFRRLYPIPARLRPFHLQIPLQSLRRSPRAVRRSSNGDKLRNNYAENAVFADPFCYANNRYKIAGGLLRMFSKCGIVASQVVSENKEYLFKVGASEWLCLALTPGIRETVLMS